ncbi:unnamed protein product [Microthlaspi erraticum]|uniref:Uncharacterized protein n=1 Tax=Microthlaspi erraticum TaxID=1685480 RepID=A0A6D2KTT3_9BRAS|nr:unnamed protein product [Microthlaspi erraticum]
MDENVLDESCLSTQQLEEGANGMSHSFQEDRIKEVMIILNGPIRQLPSSLKMDQWKVPLSWKDMDWSKLLEECLHAIGCIKERCRHLKQGDPPPASLQAYK